MATPIADATCPDCGAHRIARHPAGVLVYSHAADCPTGAAEDARKMADVDAMRVSAEEVSGSFTRGITYAEARLLTAAGVAPLGNTIVRSVTVGGGIVNRSWQGIEEGTE